MSYTGRYLMSIALLWCIVLGATSTTISASEQEEGPQVKSEIKNEQAAQEEENSENSDEKTSKKNQKLVI